MKILLDENIDIRFKKLFDNTSHEVCTVRDIHWNGIKNGLLLQLLKENNFNCWIVVDKNIPYQQNVANLPCSIIVLDIFRNTLQHISKIFSSILAALENLAENKVIIIAETI